jgi:2-succinyl-5-enolpyruvyl-6-hydroxy-3-cyclohexene-1-carboxylate synthase
VVVCGDGDYDAAPLIELARQAGWPVLAEPSSGARRGENALTGYQYLLASQEFMAAHRPEIIVSAGRPGLSRPQTALLRLAATATGIRHVAVTQGPGLWADPQRAATEVAAAVELTAVPGPERGRDWLDGWLRADTAAVEAAAEVLRRWGRDPVLGQEAVLTEPETARELVAALPQDALLWAGNSLSVRDIDLLMPPRTGPRVMASRGASGIDGTASTAIGAALAHAADCPGAVAFALIGDLSLLHDAPGLAIGPGEPRPDLCLVVVNNDGGGIFEGLEPGAFKAPPSGRPGALSVFERVFGTPHGASVEQLAAAFGIPYTLAERPGDVAKAAAATVPGTGLRIVEARTGRAANTELRAQMRAAAIAAAS